MSQALLSKLRSKPSRPFAKHYLFGKATARNSLIVLDLLFAVGAISGGLVLALYPDGSGPMQFDIKYLRGSPFASYLVPGLFLSALGVSAVVAAFMHVRHVRLAPHISFFAGSMLVAFEVIETTLIPFSVLQVIYLLVGVVIVALSTQVERNEGRPKPEVTSLLSRVNGRTSVFLLLAILGLYALTIRPWFINRDATSSEQQMLLPGDELNPKPGWQTTRAITIDAPADVVWAWLIQHGQDRGGFYSYDWLEDLTGADIHNADKLHPEWQQRQVGDKILMARPDLLGGAFKAVSRYNISIVQPGAALVTGPAAAEPGKSGGTSGVSSRVLIPIDANKTRLIWREREGFQDSTRLSRAYGSIFRWLFWEPTHFVMQYGIMTGVKARAEGNLHEPQILYYGARLGWLVAAPAVAIVLLRRESSRVWLGVALLPTLPAIFYAADPNAALAGFISSGVVLSGALSWGRRWWPWFTLLAAFVLLALVLTADAYLAFGLMFGVVFLVGTAWRLFMWQPHRLRERV